MHGWVTIGTKLDTKQLEQDIKTAEKQLKEYNREGEKLTNQKVKIEQDLTELEEGKKYLEEQFEENRKLVSSAQELNSLIKEQAQIMQVVDAGIEATKEDYNDINRKIKENNKNHADTTKELENNRQKLAQAIQEIQRAETFKSGFNEINHSIKDIAKSALRWGIALIGVRSMYSGLRQAISMVSGQNEQIANSFQQIRSVVAGALLPVVQSVINLMVKAMVYINYIWKVLTGKNLFNFADATSKASKNLSSGAKGARGIADNLKEARKQLAGFDEMNVLSDNVASSGGGGAGAGGISADDFPNIFDSLKNVQIPAWLEKLANILKVLKDNWQLVAIAVGAFAAALGAIKLVEFIKSIVGTQSALQNLNTLGIALIVAGLTMMIGAIAYAIINYDDMTVKQQVLADAMILLGGVITGLGIALVTGLTAGIGLAIGAIIGFVAWIGKSIGVAVQEHKAVSDLTTAKKNLKTANEELANQTIDYIDKTKRAEEAEKQLKEAEDQHKISGKELATQVLNGKLEYSKMSDAQKDVYEKYMKNLEAQEQLSAATDKNKKLLQDQRDKMDKYSASLMINKLKTDDNMNSLIKGYKNGSISGKEFHERIDKMMEGMTKKEQELFKKGLPKDIQKALDPKPAETFEEHTKNSFTRIDKKAESTFGNIRRNFKTLDGMSATMTVNTKVSGVKSAKGAIVTYPKLAVGGIVNRPGRGVPVGGAITGEHGAEGVIPLTDSQQMALLGEAIGRYITVNASITNTMNGRIISRELQKISNENDFAFNR